MKTDDVPRLQVYQCGQCQTLTQRQPVICAHCLSRQVHVIETAAAGVLASWTTVRKPPLRFKSEGSYHVGVVDLDNGMRISGRLLLTPSDKPGDRVILVTDGLIQTQTPTFKVSHDG